MHRDPSGRVHRQVKRDRIRFFQLVLEITKGLLRCVQTENFDSFSPEPSGGRGKPKRLVPEFVSGEKNYLHN